ncbi:hypothetical protein ABTI28_20075, partial [Acinetobacter baumannii]
PLFNDPPPPEIYSHLLTLLRYPRLFRCVHGKQWYQRRVHGKQWYQQTGVDTECEQNTELQTQS